MKRRRSQLAWLAAAGVLAGGLAKHGEARLERRAREALPELAPGEARRAELAPGEAHAYRVELAAGQYLRLVVEQRGVDARLTFLDPVGRALAQVDTPNGIHGPEVVEVVAALSGSHRLLVRPLSGAGSGSGGGERGPYEARVEDRRRAGRRECLRVEAVDALGRGCDAAREAAGRWYRRAWTLSLAAGAEDLAARAVEGLALLEEGLAPRPALVLHRRALALYRALGDDGGEARVALRAGRLYRRLGRGRRAVAACRRALTLARHRGDPRREAVALSDLALSLEAVGKTGRALALYRRALAAWHFLGDGAAQGAVFHNLASLYLRLGQLGRAVEAVRRALEPARLGGERRAEARRRNTLAVAWRKQGRAPEALAEFQRLLALRRALGDEGGEAATLDGLGSTYLALGRPVEAARCFRRSWVLFHRLGDPRGQAVALGNLGWLEAAAARPRRALDFYRHALALHRRAGDDRGRVSILHAIARARRRLRGPEAALAALERGLELVEGRRRALPPEESLRALYLASRHQLHELHVELLVAAGYEDRALAAADRGRARDLLAAVEPRPRVPLDVAAMRALLAEEDLLLFYALGEERGFLWRVRREGVERYELPPREVIEELARRARTGLRRAGDGERLERDLAALSRVVLPVAARLAEGAATHRRLYVVPDGALHYIPFQALPLDPPTRPQRWAAAAPPPRPRGCWGRPATSSTCPPSPCSRPCAAAPRPAGRPRI